MTELTIVVHIVAKPEHLELLHDQLQGLVTLTRKEVGCVEFDLHRDNENPNHFMLFEIWTSRECWLDHRETEHLRAYKSATEGAVASFQLFQMTQTL